MADDIRDDEDYKRAKGGMFGAHVKSGVWGIAAAVAASVVLTGAAANPVILIAAVAAGAFSAYKAWSARVDETAEMADINARRTAHHMAKSMQQERAIAITQDYAADQGASGNWQKLVEQQRTQGVAAQR